MAVLEIIASAVDNASSVLESVGKTGKSAAKTLEKNWIKIGAVTAATGTGLVALAESTKDTELAIKNLSTQTGMTERESRDLTRSLINTTFSLQDANDTLAVAARRGVEGKESLAEFAQFWDLVGTATGETSAELAKSAIALEAVGINAENQGEALDAFGFISTKTTGSISNFNRFVGRMSPELRKMGIGVNDAAALLGALETKGMDSRTAMMEFRTAATTAKGDLGVLLETLGIGREEFEDFKDEVKGSGEVLEQQAKNVGQTRTIMDGLRTMMDRLKVHTGQTIQVLGSIGPALMAVGPAIKGIITLNNLWTASQIRLNLAMTANPIGLIIVAIAAAIAIGVLIVKNWDSIREAATRLWAKVEETFPGITETIVNAASMIKEKFLARFDEIKEFLIIIIGEYINIAKNMIKLVVGLFQGDGEKIKEAWSEIWGSVLAIVTAVKNSIIEQVQKVIDWVQEGISAIRDFLTADNAANRRRSQRQRFADGGGEEPETMHTGGVFRAPIAGGEGLALLRDGETILPRGYATRETEPATRATGDAGSSRSVNISMSEMFKGAVVNMSGPGDVERLNEQLSGLLRTRLRAAG